MNYEVAPQSGIPLRCDFMGVLYSPFSNGVKYRAPGYYTRIDNRPSFEEKKPSLEELMNKHLEESTQRRAEMEDLKFYALADLGASINVIPKSMFEHLKLARLRKTDMLVEMADMTKRVPIGIVENVLIKIDKFLFLSDFVAIYMLKTRNEIVILGRPFLATTHAEIDVFNKEISLGIGDDRVTFNMNRKVNNFTTPGGKF
ncbi:putative reverse transcriptase domain-containing protein [Tanacetum coccineum]|uniref:Reverse transcriptase domain-containing protein n=1 Tax=Tanacetum coccineum TaxID=301880 RepID=A0ABQ4Y2W8_9ASTR